MKQYSKTINGITYIKNRKQIVIQKDGMNTFNPTEEMILQDGWVEYIQQEESPIQSADKSKDPYLIMQEIIFEQYNSRTDITDKEALDRSIIIYNWDNYIGKSLKQGQVVVYNSQVFRVRQDILQVLEIYTPDLVPALYEVIVLTATGSIDDPIPYTPPMEIFNGKYYSQDSIIYLCIRDSQTALNYDLKDLVNQYVNVN